MATKTFEELKQLAIQIRDEKTNKANTATRIGTQMIEHLNKLEQEYYNIQTVDGLVSEYNVSVNHPTSGIDGSNKYTLSSAIALVPEKYRSVGLKCSFVNEAGKPESWKYQGGSWGAASFTKEADGGNKILEWVTDAATTRKQVAQSERKSLLQISYKNADGDIVNEQYIGTSLTDTEWAKDANWERLPNQKDINTISRKADVGSVFGAQKVEADGTSRMLEFTNFKSGLILHIIGLKIASNSYVSLYGYENSAWKIIQQNVAVGTTINKDFVLPEEVDNYSKIGFGTERALLTGGYGYILTELSIKEAIEKLENAASVNSVRTKADIGSVFGAQKVEADGSDMKLIFNNTFKEGDIIHLVNVKAATNTYWGLKGFNNGVWTTISSRLFAGTSVTRDVVIPKGTEQYEKIAIETESQLILSGYGYTVIDLNLQDVEKIKDIANYTDQLKELPIIQQDVLLPSDNLINPTIVELLGNGWWVSGYIQVDEGETYYSNASLGFFTYNESKADVTSASPFVSGSPIPSGVSFVRAKISTSGITSDEDSAINKSNDLWLSKNNKAAKYAKSFNPLLINPVDQGARSLISILMPHQGKNLFSVGDSYTMQGLYFPALLAVTGLNKIGDTGGGGNGQPYTRFPANIIKNKDLIMQCKFVTILGGTNDYGHGGEKLGTINDCIKDEYAELKVPILKLNEEGYYVKDDSIDTTYKVLTEEEINAGQTPQSVYAAIMTCVNIIHSWDKTITVVLCSQPERLPYGSQSCAPPLLRNGMNMDLLAKAMREVHEMFGVPYYDFHSNGWTIDQVEVYMNDGTLHPNALGGEKIGRGLGMYINSL